jgi:outer membrane protein assembly factor BamB
MKKTNHLITVLTVMLVFGMTASAFAQDWPQWRGVNRDGKVAGFDAPKQWPAELNAKWKVIVGLGDASPVMEGGKVYSFGRIGGDEVTMCLDAATGKEIWQDKYPAVAIAGPSASAHPGPRSTPAVSDGKVVTLGIGGVLSCLDAASGKLLWRNEDYTKELPQFFTGLSPLILNGMCIVHLGGKESGKIIAFDLKTGNQKWQCASDGPSYSSMMIMTIDGKKQIVDLTDKSLVGVDPENGKQLWQFPAPVQSRFYNAASPVIDGQTVILTGQGEGTKAVKIQKQGNEFTAQEIWKNAELGTKWNTPVLKNGFLYGLSDKRTLYCMNAKTGKTAWVDTKMLNDFGEIVDTGSLLIALPQTSSLVIYKPDEKAYNEVAVIKVADTPTYTYPICAGDKIYIKDKESLAMMTVK